MAAHAALFLLQKPERGAPPSHTATEDALELLPSPTQPAPQAELPFSVELVTMPATARPSSLAAATPARSPRLPESAQPSAMPLLPAGQDAPAAALSIRKAEPQAGDTSVFAPDKAPRSSEGSEGSGGSGGFSLRMRQGSAPGHGGRQGSLLDHAIASAPLPGWDRQGRGDLIQTEARIGLDSRSTRETHWRDSGGGTKTSVGEPFTAHIARDGRISFQDRDPIDAHVVRWGKIPMPMVAGKFDVTDAAMAAFGEVLYPYRKLKAMDQTREYRAAMAVRARGESLQSALLRFDRKLKKLWRNTALSAKERRAILFALWDECAEQGPEDVTKTAASIRAILVAFVAKELPADGSEAFSSAELARLNAERQSSQEFAPYQ